jgi:NAD(P)-dependent dehydrogenase (short-subunit alcohol dehydrogenase family)
MSLKGKVALVVGGAGKIGFPLAEGLAEAGAKVYIGSTNTANFSEAVARLLRSGLAAEGVLIDQSDEKSVQAAHQAIAAKGDKISVLVNSGVARPMTGYAKSPTNTWDRSMEVNARGLFLVCREFIPDMQEMGEGSIINVASIYGLVAPDQYIYENVDFETEPDYPYTKGGMIMYTKYLASYHAKEKITANCIAPGGYFNNQPQEFLERYLLKVPMRRMAYADDLKGAAVFLASKAAQYVTGQVIAIDGGLTII